MELLKLSREALNKEIGILRDLNHILVSHDRAVQEARNRSFPLACPRCRRSFGTYQQLAGQCERQESGTDEENIHESFLCSCGHGIPLVRLPLRITSGAGIVRRNLFEKCTEIIKEAWNLETRFARNLVRRIFREEIESSVAGADGE